MNVIRPKLKSNGVSLIELMMTVAVMGIIIAIGYPMYNDYVETASLGVMRSNMESVRLFEEDYKLSMGSYTAGTYDPGDPDNAAGLKKVLGWEPRTAGDHITYVVSGVTATGFTITATDENGHSVSEAFPP